MNLERLEKLFNFFEIISICVNNFFASWWIHKRLMGTLQSPKFFTGSITSELSVSLLLNLALTYCRWDRGSSVGTLCWFRFNLSKDGKRKKHEWNLSQAMFSLFHFRNHTLPKSAKANVWDVLIKNIKRLNRISKRRKNDSRQAFKNGFNTLSGNLTRQEQGRETDFNQMLIIQKVRNFWLYNISYWNQFNIRY